MLLQIWIGVWLSAGAGHSSAQTNGGYKVLYSFTGTNGDGAQPYSGLIIGSDGALYGTTAYSGSGTNLMATGTTFKLNTDGSGYAVLHNCTGNNGDLVPYGRLAQGRDGVLYGTTLGLLPQFPRFQAYGAVFRLGTSGNGYASLHSFSGGADGQDPFAGLVQGEDSTLYGTTSGGGSGGRGTVFEIGTNSLGYTNLYSFTGTSGDGAAPSASLVQGIYDGALYGTTTAGGSYNSGTVFTLNTNGSGYTVLYSFTGANGDGASPYGGLVQGSDGAFYGTTEAGGANNQGAVFTLDPLLLYYQVLYRFTGAGGDGANPYAGLIQGSDGALYGTTKAGGINNNGTVFKLNIDGSGYAVLYRFTGTNGDGANPYSGLVQGNDGACYGTTSAGGTNGQGTVFRLFPAVDIGLHIFAGTNILRIAAEPGVPTSPFRVNKNGTNYGILLVDTNAPNASTVRIQTALQGVKAWQKLQ